MGGAGDTGHAFAGEHEGDEHGDLGLEGHVDAGGLGDEGSGDGEVEGGAIEVEGVAEGHDEGDDAFGDAELDHALHGIGQGGVGGGGGEGENGGSFDDSEEGEEGDAGPPHDGEEDEQAEDGEGGVEGEDEFAEVDEHGEAGVSDGIGHGGADAERGELHDDAGEFEHRFGEALAEVEHVFAGFAGDLGEGDAEHHGEEDHLQDVVGGGGFEEAAGDDVFDDAGDGDRHGVDFVGALAVGGQGDADTGFGEVDGDEADDEGEGGDDLEVEDGFEGEPTDGFEVIAVAGDADDEGAEDQGHEDALDHFEEDVGEELEFLGFLGEQVTDGDADHHRQQDPLGERDAAYEGEHGVKGAVTARDLCLIPGQPHKPAGRGVRDLACPVAAVGWVDGREGVVRTDPGRASRVWRGGEGRC